MPLCVDLGGRRIIKKKNPTGEGTTQETSIGLGDGSFFFFKQKTAYEIMSGDWSSDVCSSDLLPWVLPWVNSRVYPSSNFLDLQYPGLRLTLE